MQIKFINLLDKNEIKSRLLSKKTLVLAVWIISGFLTANAKIFGIFSPFGISLSAAVSFTSLNGIGAIAGVLCGYSIQGMEGIFNILVCAFIIALKHMLKTKHKTESPAVSIIAAFFLTIIAGYMPIFGKDTTVFNLLLLISQGIVCASAVYFFMKTIPLVNNSEYRQSGLNEIELTCMIISMSVILLSLSGFNIGSISIGRMVGVFIVLCCAYYGSMTYGSLTGVITGIVLSLGGPPQGAYIVGSFAFGGLLAGVFSKFKYKLGSALAFIISGSLVTMYINGYNSEFLSLVEIFIACSVFMLLPQTLIKNTASFFLLTQKDSADSNSNRKFKEMLINRLVKTSDTLSEISDTIINSDDVNDETLKVKINDALINSSERVCKNCRICMNCWGISYNDTVSVFNTLTDVYFKNGKIEMENLPGYFASRCEKKDTLITELNISLTKLYIHEKQKDKYKESRILLAEQYKDFGDVLERLTHEFKTAVRFDEVSENGIRSYLKKIGCKNISVWSYTDVDDLTTVDIEIDNVAGYEELINSNEISRLTGCEMEISSKSVDNGDTLCFKFCERENFSISCCSLSRSKDLAPVCGDTSSSFRGLSSKYILALSDGMGTGDAAGKDSATVIKFLEKLLQAGFDKESALKLLNSALLIKNENESFATVDIASISLVNGKTEFIKAGAAPSFIKSNIGVYQLGCSSLPAGVLSGSYFEKTKCKLNDGDMLIMISDGINSADEKLIIKTINEYNGNEPQELAALLLDAASGISEVSDDMTVLVGKVLQKAA